MTQATSEALLAVLNSLWQAAAVAALAWVALRFLKTVNAATRYAIWWVVLAVALALPVAPAAIRGSVQWWQAWAKASPAAVTGRAPAQAVIPLVEEQPAIVTLPHERSPQWPLWIAGLWAALCAYRLWQIGRSYLYLRGVKRRAKLAPQRLPAMRRTARVLVSNDVASPMAVGFLHPAVILPEGLPEQLAPTELEHVLLHEFAHIERKDDWSNLLAKALGAALALHPVAWWILREIEREREIACDEWVVARVGAARPYAESLARVSELRWARKQHAEPGEALAAGMLGGGSRLGERIELLLRRGREISARVSKTRVCASAGLLAGCLIAGSLAPGWIALAQEPLRFEVASVKPMTTDRGRQLTCESGRGFRAKEPLFWLIFFAYNVSDDQILGGPSWVKSDDAVFDVEGKPATPPVSSDDCRRMAQILLAERFKLALHRETREMQVYALVQANRGTKLREAEGGEPPFPRSGIMLNGAPIQVNDNYSRGTARGLTMQQLGRFLERDPRVGRLVIDETNLKGIYQLTLDYSTRADDEKPDLFTALQEQLGLKLEARKEPVEVLVIDHAEKPDEN